MSSHRPGRPDLHICTLLTEPKDGGYGEPVVILVAGIPVTLPTDYF